MDALTQFLIFELGTACNLGRIHAACPNQHPGRFEHLLTAKQLDDDTILTVVSAARENGFHGLIGWHYYNEPLMQRDRMFGLMDSIRRSWPAARFVLWTNGTLLPGDVDRFAMFEQIHVTDYTNDGAPPRHVARLKDLPGVAVHVHRWSLDGRLTMQGPEHPQPCVRPYTEFIVDAYGNVHLCCYDWQGLGSIGNVLDDPIGDLFAKWQAARAKIAANPMAPDAPAVCRKCTVRCNDVTAFDRSIHNAAARHIAATRNPPKKLAMVFVNYKIPQSRLSEHFAWNDAAYRVAGVRVYVVTDAAQYDFSPGTDYVRQVRFPASRLPQENGKPVFSLSATKNAGIALAIADGAEVVATTDVDVAFPVETLEVMRRVDPGEATVPIYRMVLSYADRAAPYDHDVGCTGTVAMTAADWQACQYDERCYGYGAEDGALLRDMAKARIAVCREDHVWHVEHPGGQGLKSIPGHGRPNCWNRDSINPDRFDANKRVAKT